jgi:hypothetical protein
MDPATQTAALLTGAVAVLCAIVAVAAWRAVVHTGNRAIYGVAGAFALLSAKNLLKCVNLAGGVSEGPSLEVAFSLTDLAAVGLIAWPILARRKA